MAKITYNGESESISWHGVAMTKGKAVETDNAELLKAADKHPLFTVSKARAEKPATTDDETDVPVVDKATAGGAKAKADGKPRNVPAAYRNKPEGDRWLVAYDGEPSSEVDEAHDESEA
ncbi:MAG: hypothetical protein Q7T60_17240 [Sphingopyxis sp.]|nr:hypothetical protein [Sphingopyxis sp.]